MAKWFVSSFLVFVTIGGVYFAFSPLFITYARVLPPDIFYELGNQASIENAIIQTEQSTIEFLREIYGDSMLVLALIAILNLVIAVVLIVKRKQ